MQAALAAAVSGAAAAECRAPLPLSRPDPILQTQLSQGLRSAGLEGPLRRRELVVALVDLTNPGEHFYAGVNDDHMLYAASLPKIGILLALGQEPSRFFDELWEPKYPTGSAYDEIRERLDRYDAAIEELERRGLVSGSRREGD